MKRYSVPKMCDQCPYKKGSGLHETLSPERKREFWRAHIEKGEHFDCHKTLKKGKQNLACFGTIATQMQAKGGMANGFQAVMVKKQGTTMQQMLAEEVPLTVEQWINDADDDKS